MSDIATKNDPLLTLRAYACALVLLGHGFMIAFAPENLVQLAKETDLGWITASPWVGVWVFFVLSGYLIGKGFFKKRYLPNFQGIKNFYFNRLLRILPLYWIAVIVVSVLVVPQIFSATHFLDYLQILFFTYDGQHQINPIGALWSVSTEMNFYLVAPFIFVLLRGIQSKKSIVISFLLALIVGATIRSLCWNFLGAAHSWNMDFYIPLITNLDLFIFGMLLNPLIALYQKRGLAISFPREKGLIIMGAFYVFVTYLSRHAMIICKFPQDYYLHCWVPTLTALVIGGVIFLFEFARSQNERPTGWAHTIIAKTQIFGMLTYALYVWHEPIFIYLNRIFPARASLMISIWQWSVAMMFCTALAWVSHEWIEKRFEKKKMLSRP